MAKKETFSSIQQVDKKGFLKKLGIVVAAVAVLIMVAGVIHVMRSPDNTQVKAPEAPTPSPVPSSIRYYDPASEETYDVGTDYIMLNQSNGNSIRVNADGTVSLLDENGNVIMILTGNDAYSAIEQALGIMDTDVAARMALSGLELPEPPEEEPTAEDIRKQLEEQTAALLADEYDMTLDDFYRMLYENDANPDLYFRMLENGNDMDSLIQDVLESSEGDEEGIPGFGVAVENLNGQVMGDEVADSTEYPDWLQTPDYTSGMTAALNSIASAASSSGTQDTQAMAYENANHTQAKRDWLEEQQNVEVTSGRIGPYDLVAGTVVPITIVTGINSDLPGDIVGLVRQDVYDTLTGTHILIPKGSRLMATYNSSVAWGQKSLQIAWNQLITPDGYVFTMPGFQGIDGEGYAGVEGHYNNHFWSILGGALLGSIINYGAGYVSDTAASIGNAYQIPGADGLVLLTNSATDTTMDVVDRWISRIVDRQPTITIETGTQTQLLVNQTINLQRK